MTCSLGQLIFNYQTLISGVLAILAAVVTTWAILHTARLPLTAQEAERKVTEARRRAYVSLALGRDLFTLAARARSAQGTIRVVVAGNVVINDDTREKVHLRLPAITQEWESMAVLPEQAFLNLSRLMRLVEDHNFDMARAGGAFGADYFRQVILDRVQKIEITAKSVASQIDMLRAEGRVGVRPQEPS